MSLPSAPAVPVEGVHARFEKPQTFVIVDDSAVIRRRLVSLLAEIDGVKLVGESDNAVEAADLIRRLRPDVMISDIRMPDRSGIGLLEDIRHDATPPHVIVLTNYPYAAYRKRCMELGARHFFDKSTEFHELERVVRELARSAR